MKSKKQGSVGFSIWIWIIGLVIIITLLLSWNRLFPVQSVPIVTLADPSVLPGLMTSTSMWSANIPQLQERLAAIGLPALSNEGQALHIHQHLDIIIDGTSVDVPADIGINRPAGFISDLHVHDTLGVIHVESPTIQTFTLGQFFDVWGLRLTTSCIGGYCTTGDKSLKVYVNGNLYEGNPRLLTLLQHQEIVIIYGTANESPKSIPSTFNFPDGD